METWREIYLFPEYSVSDYGRVRNNYSRRMMTLLVNQQGIVHVGLSKDRVQHRRSVAVLVASSFITDPTDERFDTPINLDGDRSNNYASNLTWRPRWFAVKYFRQFKDTWYENDDYHTSVEDVETTRVFKSSWDAAVTYGLLVHDVFVSTIQNSYVWPTNQRFRPNP